MIVVASNPGFVLLLAIRSERIRYKYVLNHSEL